MRFRKDLRLALGAAFLLGVAPGPRERPDPAAAESLARKIEDIRERHRHGAPRDKEFRLSEGEVNAYLQYKLGDYIPKGVEDLWVRIGDDLIHAGGTLDLASLRERLPDSSLARILAGQVPLEAAARLNAEDGVGRLDLQAVSLAGLPVPKALLQQLVSAYSKSPSRPEGVRLEDPFALPYGIRSARFTTGEVILRQGSPQSAGARSRSQGVKPTS